MEDIDIAHCIPACKASSQPNPIICKFIRRQVKVKSDGCAGKGFQGRLVSEFEFVTMPLAFSGIAMFIDETLHYTILEKTSNEAFEALWIEFNFSSQKNNLRYYLQATYFS